MDVLIIVDKIPSAISTLALALEKYLTHLNIKVLAVHPKRVDMDTLYQAQNLMTWADIIDVHYWKSGEVLRTTFPTEFATKPKVLFHFNPYDTDKMDWGKDYKLVVAGNSEIQLKIAGSYHIPYGADLDFFKYNINYTKDKTVEMTVARIESKKGILEVAKVCEKLGYKLILVGRVSEPEYMREIMQNKCVEFHEDASDQELRDIYYRSAIHVCNSVDNFESGTLPVLEAMACGVPVLTRNVGHVPDLSNGENIIVRDGAKDDLIDLELKLKELMEADNVRERIREKAWETVKNRSLKIMARRINKLYYRLLSNTERWVSTITPTFDRPDTLLKTLCAINEQTYPYIEMVVVDSGNISVEPMIKILKEQIKRPIKYIRFDNHGEYTLPKARNLGVQSALGEVLVFCDDRILMDKEAVANFEAKCRYKVWLWGEKDGYQKGFVENFSSTLREGFIKGGMFNERVNVYGGQTQECRTRFEGNEYAFEYVASAKAKGLGRSGKSKKRDSIVQAKYILQELYE